MRETKRDERHSASELLYGGILTEATGLTFGLEQAENVISLDCWCEKKKLALIHGVAQYFQMPFCSSFSDICQ